MFTASEQNIVFNSTGAVDKEVISMRKNIILSLLIIFAITPFVYAQAVNPIGTIMFIEGISDVARNNQEPVFLKEGQPVYLGDRIRTKSYSKIGIKLADKSVVKLAPSTCVLLEEFKLVDNNQKREFARIKLTRGKLEAVVAKTGSPETFVIDTPNSRGAVKGSDIFVSFVGGKTGIFVQEGALSVFNFAKPDVKTNLVKGNSTTVPFNDVPQGVRSFLDLEMTIHKRDVEKVLVKKWIPAQGAAQMNALITTMSGTVRIYKKGAQDWKDAQANEVLDEGDKVQTGEDGKVQLRMTNGNTLFVQPGTELIFSTMRYDAATGNFENTFDMAKGKVGGVVEKLSKESTFQLKTPTAVCGVRGTVLEVIAPAPTLQEPAPQTQVFYEGGNGVVTSLLTGQSQDVAAGQNVSVDPSGNISQPVATTPDQRGGLAVVQEGTQGMTEAAGGAGGGGGSDEAAAALAQAQGGVAAVGEGGVAALGGDTQNMDIMSTLTFDEVVGTTTTTSTVTGPNILYSSTLHFDTGGFGYPNVGPCDFKLQLLDDNTWKATVEGNYNGVGPSSWSINLNSGTGDTALIDGMGFYNNAAWSGSVSGTIAGYAAGTSISGNASGDSHEVVTNVGTFTGSASGTWH